MKIISITGSIAVGKSTLCKELEKLGYKVFYTDEYVKKLYKKRSFLKKLQKYFPEAIKQRYYFYYLRMDIFKNLIFKNFDHNLDIIENIVHSKVKKHIKFLIFIYTLFRKKALIFETALLFEAKLDKLSNYVIYLQCLENKQKERFLQRPGNKEVDFDKFYDRQNKNIDYKLSKSNIVIDTTNFDKEDYIKIANTINNNINRNE